MAISPCKSPGHSMVRPMKAFPLSFLKMNQVHAWIGTANTKSSLHFDYYENVLCQIVGSKRVWLVDPRFTSKLYQYSSNIDKSKVDAEAPDFQIYPKFRAATVLEGQLEQGDCLYIPKSWADSTPAVAGKSSCP